MVSRTVGLGGDPHDVPTRIVAGVEEPQDVDVLRALFGDGGQVLCRAVVRVVVAHAELCVLRQAEDALNGAVQSARIAARNAVRSSGSVLRHDQDMKASA